MNKVEIIILLLIFILEFCCEFIDSSLGMGYGTLMSPILLILGTIIMLDDWFCFRGNPNKGEQKAFREWLENNPLITATEFHKYCTESISFIIHRQND